MGKRRKQEKQADLWVATATIVEPPGHVFYERLEAVLRAHRFDRRVEHLCRRFYAGPRGRPSLPPGVYFRLLLIGYFEGLDSERGIAWRVADSLSLRRFLGYGLDQVTPDHSTISRTRRLYWLSTHAAVFRLVLRWLAQDGVLVGRTVGVDATTLEANAAMRTIVRRDTGQRYDAYVRALARSAGLEEATPEQVSRFDRKRKKRTSNRDWTHPHDPDARVAKMKDGRTHLAHKAEHAVDLDSGALLAITLQPADAGDTVTLPATAAAAQGAAMGCGGALEEVVTDKGYHSNSSLEELEGRRLRPYMAEPERGRRRWKGKSADQKRVYANRRRMRGRRGKALLKKRAELTERSFAHMYETGGMRRVHLRGHKNILKRLLVHGAGFNLGLLLRVRYGMRKPRTAQGRGGAPGPVRTPLHRLLRAAMGFLGVLRRVGSTIAHAARTDSPLVTLLPARA